MVLIQLNCKPIILKKMPIQILLFNKSNWEAIISGLNSFYHDWLNVDIANVNANTLWIQFHDKLLYLIDNHVPHKTARKKCGLSWITTEIRRTIRKRNRLYSMYKTSNSPVFYDQFKSLKWDIQKRIHISHQQYISSLVFDDSNCLHDNNKFWTYIKILRKDKQSIPPLSLGDTVISESLHKSEVFNNYLSLSSQLKICKISLTRDLVLIQI